MPKTAQPKALISPAQGGSGEAKGQSSSRKTQVRRSGIHGKGVYALRSFNPGDLVIEYKGERISWPEAQRRHECKSGDPYHTFYFQTEVGEVIDGGGVGGNSARWINHSCEPNCEAEEDAEGRVYVVALLPIASGDELFYDYALEIDEPITAALKRDYLCLCGTPSCRGTLLKTSRKPARSSKTTRLKKASKNANQPQTKRVKETPGERKTAAPGAQTKP